ncbi:MAG TPA: PEP/pyruvate-binding domain-containing protein [Longimicrobiales bacterium]
MAGSDSRVPAFDRAFFGSEQTFTRIGGGSLGGKAAGLISIREALEGAFPGGAYGPVRVDIPRLTVLGTDLFDAFMDRNGLHEVALSERSDERIAHAFQKANAPAEALGDLRALADRVHSPLAVRSSSLLEDALRRPFAGVYETKMIPNNQPDAGERFQRLVEAVKLIWASTFFEGARTYRGVVGEADKSEKMAVIVQEVVGRRHGDRFYPDLSLVGRSFNYYPSGRSRPEEGVVNLALGLGKTIVDGGLCWGYCPVHPKAPPPFGSVAQLLDETQTRFWAVNMGAPPAFDPIAETEYLVEAGLAEAEYDGTLAHLASTYDAASDRLSPGTGRQGPRALNFAPLLDFSDIPLNDLVRRLLEVCEEGVGAEVEIEAAMTLPATRGEEARLGFLQVRPMVAPDEAVDIGTEEMTAPDLLVASTRAMGNGVEDGIQDVVYTKPDAFQAKLTRVVAREIEAANRELVALGRPYLLVGFGRWGSSDPWLGIPVTWSQVAGARAIVEASLPSMNVDPSQGSHFFHNLSSFQVSYFTVHHARDSDVIDWNWLAKQPAVAESELLRHVRLENPLLVRVDGRTGRGVVHARRKP